MPSLSQKQTAENLKDFFQAVQRVTHADPREPARQLYDMGLIIQERGTKTCTPITLDALLGQGRAHYFTLQNRYTADDFINVLVEANDNGLLLVVSCMADPAPAVITLLKQLSETGACTIPDANTKEAKVLSLHPDARIVFCLSSQTLEQIITYPYFINLFGPVLRIS